MCLQQEFFDILISIEIKFHAGQKFLGATVYNTITYVPISFRCTKHTLDNVIRFSRGTPSRYSSNNTVRRLSYFRDAAAIERERYFLEIPRVEPYLMIVEVT